MEVPKIHFPEPFLRNNWLRAAAEIKKIQPHRVAMMGNVAVAYGVYGITGTDCKGLVSVQTDTDTGLMAAEWHTAFDPDNALTENEPVECVAYQTPEMGELVSVEGMPHMSAGGALAHITKLAFILCNQDVEQRRIDNDPYYKLFKLHQDGHKLASPELVQAINQTHEIEFPLLGQK